MPGQFRPSFVIAPKRWGEHTPLTSSQNGFLNKCQNIRAALVSDRRWELLRVCPVIALYEVKGPRPVAITKWA